MPSRPSLPNSCASSRTGASPRSYHSATYGRTRSSATRRVSARTSFSSSSSRVSRSSRSSGAIMPYFLSDALLALAPLRCSRSSLDHQDAGVDLIALLQRRAQRAVQTVLQIERALIFDDVREQISVEGGVLGEQLVQGELTLGGGQV